MRLYTITNSEMETRDHSKNGASPKSHTSRGNMRQRAFLFFVAFCVSVASMYAQDVITLINGETIKALVFEVGDVDVKFKKFENPQGPNYSFKKSNIFMILYANGTKDVFTKETAPANVTTPEIATNSAQTQVDNASTNTNFILKKNHKIIIEPYAFIIGGKKRYTLLQKKLKQMGFCCVFLKNQKNITGGEEDVVIVVHPAGPTTRYHIFDKVLDRKVFDEVYGNWTDSHVVNKFIKDITPFIEK